MENLTITPTEQVMQILRAKVDANKQKRLYIRVADRSVKTYYTEVGNEIYRLTVWTVTYSKTWQKWGYSFQLINDKRTGQIFYATREALKILGEK